MMSETVRIATRGSNLALYQANMVKAEIAASFPEISIEIVILKTTGDKVLDVSLSRMGDKGLFTKELENSLLQKETDIAVHSLKDLPTVLPEELQIGGVLPRGDCRDALVSHKNIKFKDLTSGHVVATSSLRRKAQLLMLNKDLNIIDIRGNVDTRIGKMKNGYCDAMVMAAAGLQRLGLDSYITEILEPELLVPAVGQGAIAMQIRKNDQRIERIVKVINHDHTYLSTHAERIFLHLLEGGCQIPVGCYTSLEKDIFYITGFISNTDGSDSLKFSKSGPVGEAYNLAQNLAMSFIRKGASEIVERIRQLNQQ